MKVVLVLLVWALAINTSAAQQLLPYYYVVGTPALQELYVDPNDGNDAREGTSRTTALRTVQEAWRKIPSTSPLTTGYRINLMPGTYGDDADELPNYWELKRGTYEAPIIVRAAEGRGTVRFTGDINMAEVSYFYLLDIEIRRGGDTFHCERCDHILLRGNVFNGAPDGRDVGSVAHETIKFNQSQFIFIENNVIRGADDNAIDWVAVQYGHIVGNKISDAQSWCTYVKGGSAYIRIEGNEFFNCFEGGVTAGQGTGLEYTVAPWFRYEAYDIKIINNIIHDITGAALGVNGGYNILIAHNTAYKVGSRSHLIEAVHGLRSCDEDSSRCAARISSGAWGTSRIGGDFAEPIGNRRVKILNNVIYNPSDYQGGDQHFAIHGPRTTTNPSVPSPQRTDDDLEIAGNVIWNGGASMPLGIEDDNQGCRPSNPTCNEQQLLRDNAINTIEPRLSNAESGDFRPATDSLLFGQPVAALDAFPPRSDGEATPEGVVTNAFLRDFSGSEDSVLIPGAFSSATATINPPDNSDGGTTPDDPGNGGNDGGEALDPDITGLTARLTKKGRTYILAVRFTATDDGLITKATAKLNGRSKISLRKRGSVYSGSKKLRSKRAGSVIVSLTDDDGNNSTAAVDYR